MSLNGSWEVKRTLEELVIYPPARSFNSRTSERGILATPCSVQFGSLSSRKKKPKQTWLKLRLLFFPELDWEEPSDVNIKLKRLNDISFELKCTLMFTRLGAILQRGPGGIRP